MQRNTMVVNSKITLLFIILILISKSSCAVVTTDPGDYIPLPENTNTAMIYWQYAERDTLRKGSKKVDSDFKLKSDIYVARFGHYSNWNGHPVTFQTLIPFGEIEMKSPSPLKSSGIGDVILLGSIWFTDGPEDSNYYALGSFITLPTGKYDGNNAGVNIGNNRLSTGVQGAWSRQVYGKLWSELVLEGAVYGHNDDYAGETLKQKPTAETQLHLRYNVSDKTRLAVSYYNQLGGKQSLAGEEQQGGSNNNRVIFTVGSFIYPTVDVQLQAGRDVYIKNGPQEDLRLQLRLATIF